MLYGLHAPFVQPEAVGGRGWTVRQVVCRRGGEDATVTQPSGERMKFPARLALPHLARENLEIPKKLESHFEHIDVVVVVFDIKHFGHDADSIPVADYWLARSLALASPYHSRPSLPIREGASSN